VDYDFLLHVGLVFAVIGLFFFAVVAACLWEKRPVQPYYVPEPGKEYEPSSEAREGNLAALRLNYTSAGLAHDGKSSLYRVRYDFWLSPDGFTFAVVSSGTIAKLPVYGIWLWSRLKEGQILNTTNEIGEQDISGVEEQQTWPRYSFHQLHKKHRLRRENSDPIPFPAEAPLQGFFDIRRRKADALVERGLARYLDEDGSVWKYTLKEAIKFYFIGVWVRPIQRCMRMLRLIRE
jgi:hypothetical protein